MMEMPCLSPGVGQLSLSTFHPTAGVAPQPQPPTTLSLSSSSSSSGGGGSGSGSGGPGSSSGSGGSNSGSNPGLNLARTPLSSIPPPSNVSCSGSNGSGSGAVLLQGGGSGGGGGMYQIHDGFATVRKRKGPTAASIAMRQQQECYDLAQPASAIVSAMAAAAAAAPQMRLHPSNRASVNHKRQGSFMQRLSSNKDKDKDKDKKSNGSSSNGVVSKTAAASTKNGKSNGSASLLSTHPSINLGLKSSTNGSKNPVNSSKNGGYSLIPVRKQSSSSVSSSGSGSLSPSSQQVLLQNSQSHEKIQIQLGHLSPTQSQSSGTSSFSGGCGGGAAYSKNNNTNPRSNGLILKDYRRNSLATSTPWETSCSSDHNSFVFSPSSDSLTSNPTQDKVSDIHKTRLKPSSSSVSSSNGSNSSLGRRLRRLVLPNRMSMPNGKSPGSLFEEEDAASGGSNNLLMCKSPSASALCNENGCGNGVSCNNGSSVGGSGGSVGRLRNSISDNSIVGSSGGPGSSNGNPLLNHHNAGQQGGGGGHNRGELCHSGGHVRNFHRSCLLPKAPQLEPVMEDGIPWRQPKKDVPWWDMAIRKGRYRSCPILQVSQQAHVVAAFEQSLSNMTQRIQSLTCSSEAKDSELLELKQTIELLRKQSIEAGLTVASMNAGLSRDGSPIARQLSADSVSSINSISSACSCTSHSHSHTSSPSGQVTTTPLGTPTHGSGCANNHSSSHSNPPDSPKLSKKHGKNKGWLRSSFTKAFSRSKTKPRNGSSLDEEGFLEIDGIRRPSDLNGDSSSGHHHHHHHHGHHSHHNGHHHHHQSQNPSHKSQCSKLQNIHNLQEETPLGSPLLSPPQSNGCSSSSGSHSPRSNSGTNASSGVCEDFGEENKSVDELKKQLREKEMVLTDIRLEALTSAHQLESLKETVNKMRNEMLSLKQDNERLQRIVTCKSLTSSQTSLQMITTSDTVDRRLSASEVPPPSSSNLDVLLCEASDKEGKRIIVTVFIGCHGSYERYISSSHEGFPCHECNIGSVCVSSKTKWDVLDAMIKRAFKEYLTRVDPISNLGLSADSIMSYNVGEVLRTKDGHLPELLPCGYLVGDVTKIRVCLKGAGTAGCLDALSFETLVPKSILQRYITLLSDHGRIILCGPSGTGKSYLARKIGEYLVARCGKDPCPEAIATFSADHKNSKELRQYLANLAEQCESGNVDLPSVIILDNLHQVSSFGEVFSGYLNSKQSGGPVIIGTMTQSTASTPNLQLHHNFRWVLFGNHMEPVKGLLSRYLQRRLVETDVQNGSKNVELARVMDWIPKIWLHINKFLETHNSSEVTIGPRLFLSCPTDVANSQVWFTDLWHYSIIPYIMEAVKEGLQLYGKKAGWEDPCLYLLQTYPWTEGSHGMSSGKSSLLRLRPEDVGYDTKSEMNSPGKLSKSETNGDQDPLMNMLMRLQEAANYSGPQSNESGNRSMDRTSLDKDFITTA